MSILWRVGRHGSSFFGSGGGVPTLQQPYQDAAGLGRSADRGTPTSPPGTPRQPAPPAESSEDDLEDDRSGPSIGLITGIVAAVVVLALMVGGTIVAVTVGRPTIQARREAAEQTAALEKENKSAVEIVERTLQRYGYTEIYGNITLEKDGRQWSVTGWASGAGQRDVPFRCVYEVHQRARRNSWNLKSVEVDGAIKYESVVR
jgi:hypothetical protein